MTLKTDVLAQLDALIATGGQLAGTFRLTEYASYESNAPEQDLRAFVTSALAAVERISGNQSQYFRTFQRRAMDNKLQLPDLIGC